MDQQKPIFEFLSKPENLTIALEVAKYADTLRKRLHESFWEEITRALQTRMGASSFTDRWLVSTLGDFDKAYASRNIYLKTIPETFTGSTLSVCLMQSAPSGKYRLYYGLVWSKTRSAPLSDSYSKLLQRSRENGFSEKGQVPWWPACTYLEIYPGTDEFTLEYGVNRAEFIDRLAERVWAYFVNIEAELYQFNQDMLRDG
jgi:hypothetical protein